MDRTLFALQRLTAMLMAPFVLVHLGLILYAVRGGLTASEILGRTQGNWIWILFYLGFVACVAIHAPIGVRSVLIEWCHASRRAANGISLAFALVVLALGVRAVISVGGLAS
ncbi:succinate dehydrogenase [Achromobacter deleyi]|uniref:succinate dehydrogenase n=1 Tax=Achromobacter deleyi TaxID=1353891 RepID=UPI001491E71A|nr:succinate dehydrogenase [Achromobacter deleyi]QVQ26416.1 succinate dehydrogenase [Achromobacter deleyi]UIP21983.1 succinate dehydrogenase [Achromobacter deleyi]